MMYYIRFRSLFTGFVGRLGTRTFPKDEAQALAAKLNQQHTGFFHWIEAAE